MLVPQSQAPKAHRPDFAECVSGEPSTPSGPQGHLDGQSESNRPPTGVPTRPYMGLHSTPPLTHLQMSNETNTSLALCGDCSPFGAESVPEPREGQDLQEEGGQSQPRIKSQQEAS